MKKKRLPADREASPLLASKLATRSHDGSAERSPSKVVDEEPDIFVPKDKPFKIVSQAERSKIKGGRKKGGD